MKPNGTEEFILLDQIVVTEGLLNSNPSVEKIQQVMNHVKRTGYLDEPITIKRDTNPDGWLHTLYCSSKDGNRSSPYCL